MVWETKESKRSLIHSGIHSQGIHMPKFSYRLFIIERIECKKGARKMLRKESGTNV